MGDTLYSEVGPSGRPVFILLMVLGLSHLRISIFARMV